MASEQEIVVGCIVTIQLDPEKYFNNLYQGKQGEVMVIADDEHKDGPIGVKFPAWYEIVDPHFFDNQRFTNTVEDNDSVIRFERNELRVDSGWRQPEIPDEQLCDLLFGRSMWHTRYNLKAPFIPGYRVCQYKDCSKKAFLRIIVNCWGVITEYDVCSEHAVWHGRNCDGFPAK